MIEESSFLCFHLAKIVSVDEMHILTRFSKIQLAIYFSIVELDCRIGQL